MLFIGDLVRAFYGVYLKRDMVGECRMCCLREEGILEIGWFVVLILLVSTPLPADLHSPLSFVWSD